MTCQIITLRLNTTIFGDFRIGAWTPDGREITSHISSSPDLAFHDILRPKHMGRIGKAIEGGPFQVMFGDVLLAQGVNDRLSGATSCWRADG